MDYSQPFSTLNERLRPRITASDKLYSSLTRMEDRQWYSVRAPATSYRPTILPARPEPVFSVTAPEPEHPTDAEVDAGRADSISDDLREGRRAGRRPSSSSRLADVDSKDEGGEEQVDGGSGTSSSEETDAPGELASERTGDSAQAAAGGGEGEGSSQRSYIDGTLPDLIRSGRPLGRRRTLGHVSVTLKEVRREVELSRRRSIKLKAQVDKLQESREGTGWSHDRERVTEEVLSVLRLLRPLTDAESGPPEPPPGENRLDAALALLQNVARKLAIGNTTQKSKSGRSAEDSAVLQQALCDRDEAIAKKKAMETELLRSKTEMMLLNNQLLEAVQKRLELSLELEAWKEDVQLILQQQVQSQQRAEQAEKKSSRMGILRRHNKPPMQRPSSIPASTPAAPTTNSSQIFIPKSATSAAPSPNIHRTWRDKLKVGKTVRQGEQVAAAAAALDSNGSFQVVSLD